MIKPAPITRDTGSDTGLLLGPNPEDPRLSQCVQGTDQTGKRVQTTVCVERPLTLYLNKQEIVTMMSICDYPEYLALGYLLNQNMLSPQDTVARVEYADDINAVVVHTDNAADYSNLLAKRTITSGCGQGSVFGDMMARFRDVVLCSHTRVHTADLRALMKRINTMPSLYLSAGAIHGCVLCQGDKPLLYMEDVGRHNAVDKIAGYMYRHGIDGADKVFYTTGRLTSEMVIKTVQMGISILVSRSGFTAWGVALAREVNLTLIGRARGERFMTLSGAERIIYDGVGKGGKHDD